MENNEKLIPKIINQMRILCSEQKSISDVMHYLAESVPEEHNHPITLMRYARAAFFLSLNEASPICGWEPDGTGEISDYQLNELITPTVHNNESKWKHTSF